MSDPRKDAILRERILTARPVRPAACGLVPIWNIAKVMDPTAVRPIWDCAVQASGLVGNHECLCWVDSFEEEVQKWKAAEMFGAPTLILVDLLVEMIKTNQFETVIFEWSDPESSV